MIEKIVLKNILLSLLIILELIDILSQIVIIKIKWWGDAPTSALIRFQDPATTMMDGVYLFNLSLLIVIISIVVLVAWLMFLVFCNYFEMVNGKKNQFTHSTTFEVIWTSTPTLILLSLSAPSFTLLYSLDEITNPNLTFKIFGHQWYWSYEISDYIVCSLKENSLKFTCYMLTNESLLESNKLGFFRILETNKRIAFPAKTHIRLLITAVDVLHSWAIPSFGLKVDACPGRLNQTNLFIRRFGLFFGQCSEICGINHGFMPIVIVSIPTSQYYFNLIEYVK